MGHSSRFCGDADLGIVLGVASFEKGRRPASKGSSCKERAVSQGSLSVEMVQPGRPMGMRYRGWPPASPPPWLLQATAAPLHLSKMMSLPSLLPPPEAAKGQAYVCGKVPGP